MARTSNGYSTTRLRRALGKRTNTATSARFAFGAVLLTLAADAENSRFEPHQCSCALDYVVICSTYLVIPLRHPFAWIGLDGCGQQN